MVACVPKSDGGGDARAGVLVGAAMTAQQYPPPSAPARRPSEPLTPARGSAGERVLAVDEPPGGLVDDELHLGAERQGEVRYFVPGREIHEDRHVEVRQQIEQEVLELI